MKNVAHQQTIGKSSTNRRAPTGAEAEARRTPSGESAARRTGAAVVDEATAAWSDVLRNTNRIHRAAALVKLVQAAIDEVTDHQCPLVSMVDVASGLSMLHDELEDLGSDVQSLEYAIEAGSAEQCAHGRTLGEACSEGLCDRRDASSRGSLEGRDGDEDDGLRHGGANRTERIDDELRKLRSTVRCLAVQLGEGSGVHQDDVAWALGHVADCLGMLADGIFPFGAEVSE